MQMISRIFMSLNIFSPPNSRYLSPQIQNELIELCGNQIRDNIIKATGYDYPHLPGLGNNDEKLGLPERLSTVQEPISRKKIQCGLLVQYVAYHTEQ
jgi:hypothetical protein